MGGLRRVFIKAKTLRRIPIETMGYIECLTETNKFAFVTTNTSFLRKNSETRCLGRIPEIGGYRKIPKEKKGQRRVSTSKHSLISTKEHVVVLYQNALSTVLLVQNLMSILSLLHCLQETLKHCSQSSPISYDQASLPTVANQTMQSPALLCRSMKTDSIDS